MSDLGFRISVKLDHLARQVSAVASDAVVENLSVDEVSIVGISELHRLRQELSTAAEEFRMGVFDELSADELEAAE